MEITNEADLLQSLSERYGGEAIRFTFKVNAFFELSNLQELLRKGYFEADPETKAFIVHTLIMRRWQRCPTRRIIVLPTWSVGDRATEELVAWKLGAGVEGLEFLRLSR